MTIPHWQKSNEILSWALVFIVLAAPLPLGSNRPVPWMVWTMILSCIFLLYLALSTVKTPLRSRTIWPAFVMGGLFVFFAAIQSLPFLPNSAPLPRNLEVFFASKYISLSPDATRLAAVRFCSYGLLLILVYELAPQRYRQRRMAWGLFFGITAHALWAMIALKLLNDVSLWGPKIAYLGSATGTFVNRNSLATFLGMGFILGLALALDRARNAQAKGPATQLETGLVWVCLAIIAIALVSTQSRMGFLSTALGVVVVILNLKPERNLVLGIFFLGVLTLFFTGNLAQRSFLLLSDGSGRWELWRQSLAIVQVRPFIGFGLDAFAPVFALHHQPPLASDVIWEYAHNTYLSLWVECGIIFGSLPPTICAYIGLKLHRERKPLSPLPIAALAILCQNAMHSLVDFSLEMQANVFLLVAILALGLSAAMRGAESGIP